MKKLSLLICLLVPSTALAGPMFTAIIDGAQEVPATSSPGVGSAYFELLGNRLTYSITIPTSLLAEGVIGMHIHAGDRGANGAIAFGILGPLGPADDVDGPAIVLPLITYTGDWDPGEGQMPLSNFIPELLSTPGGNDVGLYVNVHTEANPGGAIRGQLVAVGVPEPGTLTLLGAGLLALGLMRRKRAA